MITELSFLLPSYNESYGVILSGINKAAAFCDKNHIKYEIIIVRNGPHTLRHKTFNNNKVSYYHIKDKGQGFAYRFGYKKAKYQHVYFNSPEIPFNMSDLNRMIKYNNEYDLIMGSKNHPLSNYSISNSRKVISKFSHYITQLLFHGFPTTDPNGSFFLRRNSTKKYVFTTKSPGYFFCFELVYKIWKAGLLVTEVPVNYRKTNNRSSVKIVRDSFQYAFNLFALKLSEFTTKQNHS